ncbi:hypothetical protein MERGE_003220 [Pneumocystis wakefieldiae]|uniref:Peptidase M16 C-terminal domain-containing protein n=1 Tax=Pneumocystis wakefieldiae TaxID=38082 RepID=A0A899G1L0_9ASCO|nr:hypothetical protein MERGE_003220 [Pneumocystis wakefieldiae]
MKLSLIIIYLLKNTPILKTIKEVAPAPLGFPPKNPYIPTNFMVNMPILNNTDVKPVILRKTALSVLWYKYGSFFYCPFGVIRILLRNPYVSMTQSNFFKLRFLKVLLYSILPIDSFYSTMAGLDFTVSLLTQGVVLFFYGYTQRIMQIYNKIIILFKRLSVDYESFNRFKSVVLSSIRSRIRLSPIDIVDDQFDDIIFSEKVPLLDLVKLAQEFDHFSINSFFYNFLSSLHFDILVSGNIPPQDALHILYMLEAVFSSHPLRLSQYTDTRVLTLENGSDYFYAQQMDKKEDRSSVLVYFEGPKMNELKKSLLLYVTHLIIKGPLFSRLRIKEQLGYIIRNRVRTSGTVLGYYVILQSERQPHVLHSRIDAFISSAYEIFRNMTSEEFNYYLEGYETVFLAKPLTILSETYTTWLDIIDRTYISLTGAYQFDFGNITIQDAMDFFKEMFYSGKRRISFYAFSPYFTDMYNVFDLPLDKLSEFLHTKGQEISEEQLREYLLLSTNIVDFHDKLVLHLSDKNDNVTVKGLLNDTFHYLSSLYYDEKMDFLSPLEMIDDITYFKANLSLSSSFINSSYWNAFYR